MYCTQSEPRDGGVLCKFKQMIILKLYSSKQLINNRNILKLNKQNKIENIIKMDIHFKCNAIVI